MKVAPSTVSESTPGCRIQTQILVMRERLLPFLIRRQSREEAVSQHSFSKGFELSRPGRVTGSISGAPSQGREEGRDNIFK
jgi:hypothetical protein